MPSFSLLSFQHRPRFDIFGMLSFPLWFRFLVCRVPELFENLLLMFTGLKQRFFNLFIRKFERFIHENHSEYNSY